MAAQGSGAGGFGNHGGGGAMDSIRASTQDSIRATVGEVAVTFLHAGVVVDQIKVDAILVAMVETTEPMAAMGTATMAFMGLDVAVTPSVEASVVEGGVEGDTMGSASIRR